MAVESLLYRPLALLPSHARAILDRLRLQGVAEPARALAGAPDNTRRPYDLVDGVAIVPIRGVLVHDDGYCWWGETPYGAIRAMLEQAVADPEVRAIVLHVDSPGGEVAGCFDLADRIFALRGVKPIAALVDEMACSAAYALASAAETILAPRSAIIGSIGIITLHLDVTAALEQAGLKVTTIQFGGRKSDSYPTTPLSGEARDRMQADVDRLGEMFVALVARNRGIDAVMPIDAAFSAVLQALEV